MTTAVSQSDYRSFDYWPTPTREKSQFLLSFIVQVKDPGTLPKLNHWTTCRSKVCCCQCLKPPITFIKVAATTSELTAIACGTWNTTISIRVIRDAPPIPVSPTIPTTKLKNGNNKHLMLCARSENTEFLTGSTWL